MNRQKSELYFLFFLLALVFTLSFFIFQHFIYSLVLAVVFSTVFTPVHKKISTIIGKSGGLPALLTTIAIVIVVITPLVFVSMQLLRESTTLYSSITEADGLSGISLNITNKLHSLEKYMPVPVDFSFNTGEYLKTGLKWLTQNVGTLFSNLASLLGSFFIFLVALYYLIKDGDKLEKSLFKLSPLQDVYNEKIFSKLRHAINSVVKGSLLIAVIQGVLTAVGFMIFDIPNASLWGSVAAIAALIPTLGTSLVIIPATIFLFLNSDLLHTAGFLIWGGLAVGLVDNFLAPKLMEKEMMIHPFFILLSAIGGILFFGPIGFLLGPIVLCLLFVLLEIYSSIQKDVA